MSVKQLLPIFLLTFQGIVSAEISSGDGIPLPRTQFDIPLAKLSASLDEQTGKYDRIKITFEGSDDQTIIGRYDDMFIKNSARGRIKSLFREPPEKAYILTDFEAKQLNRVVKTFYNTLDIFEKDLQRQRWGKCLYLDAYMPRFLKNFYFLCCAARNTSDALPQIARMQESEYDVSLNSPKSDSRINFWRISPDYVVKLRIISKELMYQLKLWQKNELTNPKRDPEITGSTKFEEAFALFVRIYFNTAIPSPVPVKAKR